MTEKLTEKYQELRDFINSIPDDRLIALPKFHVWLYGDVNFVLRMERMIGTEPGPLHHTLQIHVTHMSTIDELRDRAPEMVIGPLLVSANEPMEPEQIRQAFLVL